MASPVHGLFRTSTPIGLLREVSLSWYETASDRLEAWCVVKQIELWFPGRDLFAARVQWVRVPPR